MSDDTAQVLTILMTAPDAGEGERIVRSLLEKRLLACGNIIPGVLSLYRWEGEVHRDHEVLVVMKTTDDKAQELIETAAELHPYDVPELLVQPVAGGSTDYLNWVRTECR